VIARIPHAGAADVDRAVKSARQAFESGPWAQMSVRDLSGNLLVRWGGDDPCAPGSFCAAHGLAVDSKGDLYVAEVVWTIAGKAGLVPPDCHTTQKLQRID
jgi:hypothetical protein